MSFQVRLLSGAGLLARYGGSLLLVPAGSALAAPALELLRKVESEHPEEPGRVLPRRLAGLVAESEETPTLALVSALADGLAVLLVGDVRMVLTTESGTSVQSGRDVSTWVDRVVRGDWSSLLVTLDGAGVPDPLSDLAQGVVTAGGAELAPSAPAVSSRAPAPEPPTVVAPAPPVELPAAPQFETISLAADPEPVPQVPEEPPAAADAAVVQGIMCSRKHFNDPTSIYCAICGISMVQQTHNLVEGIRPPLGVLVMDDGSVYALSGSYVLGREPEHAPEVVSGAAAALPLDDPEVTMSRVHAKVELVDWTVELVDAGSANGTYTAAPGQTDWTRLPSGGRVVLTPGTKVALGGRTLVFDSHHKL